MKKKIYLLLLSVSLGAVGLHGQNLKRERHSRGAISTEDIPIQSSGDIFADYLWAKPPVRSMAIDMQGGDAEVNWQGQPLRIRKSGQDELTFQLGGAAPVASTAVTDAKRYRDRQKVYLKPQTVQRMVSSYRMVPHMVPQQRSRSVPQSSYNYSTKSYVTTYRTEYYTVYNTEYRFEPTWKWVTTTDYVLDIRPCKYYLASLPNGQQLAVYEEGDHYYLQNPGFLTGKTASGTSIVVIDVNANGKYFDAKDEVMFSAWNPYDRNARYQRVPGVRGNSWYAIDELETSELIALAEEAGQLKITALNSRYEGVKSKGTVRFGSFPEDAELYINGTRVRAPQKNKPLSAEYGKYNYAICKPGSMDIYGQFTVDEATPAPVIEVPSWMPAMPVKLTHSPQPSYYVTITRPDGQVVNLDSPSLLNLAPGKNHVDFEIDGMVIQRDYEASEGEELEINLSDEFKKDAAEVKAMADSLASLEKLTDSPTNQQPAKGAQPNEKENKRRPKSESAPAKPEEGLPGKQQYP
jgi:hypothetical protein